MKKLLLIIGVVLLLVAGGVGFWMLRNRQPNQPSRQGPASTSDTPQESVTPAVTPTGGITPADASVAAAPIGSTSSSIPARSGGTTIDKVPQLLLLADTNQPQEPTYAYQGKILTKEEYQKAWSASTTRSANSNSTPSTRPDSFSDKDRDGLSYEEEVRIGTDPNNADTDGDGLFDGEEVNTYKTSPKNFDTDGDGLIDTDEIKVYKSNPNKKDTDDDGFSDGTEVKSGYNPIGSGKLK